MTDIIDAEPEDEVALSFSMTVVAKLKHGVLWRAVKAAGSQRALAVLLGVSSQEVGRWINLKGTPLGSRRWPEIEKKLFDLTGQTADELFPAAVRSKDFLDLPKTIEATRDVDVRYLASAIENRMLLPSPSEEFDTKELKEQIGKALATLTYREREVIKMRYGLNGVPRTLEEVGRVFNISKELIRQIEMKAMRKLQNPIRSKILKDFLPDTSIATSQSSD